VPAANKRDVVLFLDGEKVDHLITPEERLRVAMAKQ
jgi:hypothetical protein